MRASLPHTLRERRRSRADQHRREARDGQARNTTATREAPTPPQALDRALERVRSAGGPIDEASYVCGCGFQFRARVSTTVACPHCHAQQAW